MERSPGVPGARLWLLPVAVSALVEPQKAVQREVLPLLQPEVPERKDVAGEPRLAQKTPALVVPRAEAAARVQAASVAERQVWEAAPRALP